MSIWLDFQKEQSNAPILQIARKTHALLLRFRWCQTLQKTPTSIPSHSHREMWEPVSQAERLGPQAKGMMEFKGHITAEQNYGKGGG